jgi:hypothetical protein
MGSFLSEFDFPPVPAVQYYPRAGVCSVPGLSAPCRDRGVHLYRPGRAKPDEVVGTLNTLQMLLTSAEGAVFSAEECAQWLTQAGFAHIAVRSLPPPLPYTIVTASR